MLKNALSLGHHIVSNRLGKRVKPRFLTYLVTFGCNARCMMCDSWKKETSDDLSLDEIKQVLSQLPTMDAVRLSGGEPFVRQDFPEIVAYVQKYLKPKGLHITTNGFLTKRIMAFLEERDKRLPLQLMISVDGFGEKHNEVRGHPLAWQRTSELIQWLAPRRKSLNVELSVNQTIVDNEGLDHYRQLRDFLKPFDVFNQVVIAYDESATYNLEQQVNIAKKHADSYPLFPGLSRSVVLTLLHEIEKDLSSFPRINRWFKRYYLAGIYNRIDKNQGSPNPPCVALNSHMRLYPNGDVPTCQFNSQVVGNLREQSFEEVWFGKKATAKHQWVKNCEGCWAECEVVPSAIYTADILQFSKWWFSDTSVLKQPTIITSSVD